MSPLAFRVLGLAALPVGAAATAFGGYCFYLAIAYAEDPSGVVASGVAGALLVGLGLPAFLASISLIVRGRVVGESLVPAFPLFAAGVLMGGAILIVWVASLLAPSGQRLNSMGVAVMLALALGFIRSSWKRGLTKRWNGP